MSSLLILNVDDNAAGRYIRSRILRGAGYRVCDAKTGGEALHLAAEKKPALILLDVNLPDISGLEVCQQVKEIPDLADTAILHVSATSLEMHHRVNALDGGADGYLTEPVEPEVLLATVRAILRARRAEQAQQRLERRYRRLFDANVIGLVTTNEEKIVEANDAFLRMIGASREALEQGGIDWRAITPAEYRGADERAISELLGRGACRPYEKECVRQDGTQVPVLIGAALLDREPELVWVCFIIDLTERKRLEQQLRNAQKLESVGLLAGGVAHDFNNLLTGIMGNVGLVLESLPAMDPGRDMLLDALNSSQRAADLTRQLLAYAGKGRFVVRPLDLSKLVSDIARLVQAAVPKKIQLELRLAPGLPLVEGDASQFQQLLMNLVSNAAEAIGTQAGTLSIATGMEEIDAHTELDYLGVQEAAPGCYVYLEVRDTGCGMDQAMLAQIFDPFFSTKFLGRGLGLAAVAGIVRSHKGLMRVTSMPGEGSTFRVLLPALKAHAAARGVPAGHGTVLVVDDEAVVRDVTKVSLEQYGYSVVLAEDGAAAIEAIRRVGKDVSLVVLDMAMPVMGGEEALRHMRDICPDVRVIVCTGFDEAKANQVFAGQKVDAFMQKPFLPAELAQKVREVLDS